MNASRPDARMLVGPRRLDQHICRLMYVGETDEAWTEVWRERAWRRAPLLVRDLLGAPPASDALLRRRGVPGGRGEWDRVEARD